MAEGSGTGRSEASPIELKAVLEERIKQLQRFLKFNIPGLEGELIPMGAAMIFHAAIRLYGDETLAIALAEVAKRHERYLAGLCEECGGEPVENTYFCRECVMRHKGVPLAEILIDAMYEQSRPPKPS